MINYIKGDATKPIGDGKKVIAHICNNKGAWGKGFVLSLSKKWKQPEETYRLEAKKFTNKNELIPLGNVQFVQVSNDIVVANMIAQHDIKYFFNIPPIRYVALKTCLEKVNRYCVHYNATLHAPKFGSGLAGGDWNNIEEIINSTMSVDVIIYDF
jgi:O-acetyl-ADP-ribose deacetylase (regulator of RNase III)